MSEINKTEIVENKNLNLNLNLIPTNISYGDHAIKLAKEYLKTGIVIRYIVSSPSADKTIQAGYFAVWNGICYDVIDEQVLAMEIDRWFLARNKQRKTDGESGLKEKTLELVKIKGEKPKWVEVEIPIIPYPVPDSKLIKECISKIKSITLAKIDNTPCWLSEQKEISSNVMNFKNGLYDINNDKIWMHTPEFLSFNYLNFDYLGEQPTPVYDKWQQWCWGACNTPQQVLLEEYFGYIASTAVPNKRCFLYLQGNSNTGKGTTVTLMESLVGVKYTYRAALSDVLKPHGTSPLDGKKLFLANEIEDVTSNQRKPLSAFVKVLSANEAISINPKNKPAYSLKANCVLVITANAMIDWVDDLGAVANRMDVLEYNNVVTDLDYDLDHKLAKELPGIAYKAIQGFKRITKNNKMTKVFLEEARNEQKRESSPALKFCEDMILINNNFYKSSLLNTKQTNLNVELSSIQLKELWEEWQENYENNTVTLEFYNGHFPKFSKAFQSLTNCKKVRRDSSDGRKLTFYVGVGRKTNKPAQCIAGFENLT
jgi:hypothetical protein